MTCTFERARHIDTLGHAFTVVLFEEALVKVGTISLIPIKTNFPCEIDRLCALYKSYLCSEQSELVARIINEVKEHPFFVIYIKQ